MCEFIHTPEVKVGYEKFQISAHMNTFGSVSSSIKECVIPVWLHFLFLILFVGTQREDCILSRILLKAFSPPVVSRGVFTRLLDPYIIDH